MPNILALDIGGANIKLADGAGYASSHPFALWKTPESLAAQLSQCLAAALPSGRIVVTMTGELCDCYETKKQGVQAIVAATMEAAAEKPVLFYQTTGQFVSAAEAAQNYLLTAASNWHALATFAARFCEAERGMLIDIGSTTTDIIPIENGKEVARGRTDPERLGSGELVYLGVQRTPVCAMVPTLPWRGSHRWPIANELFATSGDAYLLLGDLPEDPADNNTADGKPFTRDAAHARMARMVCGDRESVTLDEVQSFAYHVKNSQLRVLQWYFGMVAWAKRTAKTRPEVVVISGQGEFLARELLKCEFVQFDGNPVSLNERLGPDVSRCASAHALAVLASETK